MKCNKCGFEVQDTDKFCLHCGNNLENQRKEISETNNHYKNCGALLEENAKFCATCGAPVSSDKNNLSKEFSQEKDSDTSTKLTNEPEKITPEKNSELEKKVSNEEKVISNRKNIIEPQIVEKIKGKSKGKKVLIIIAVILIIVAVLLGILIPAHIHHNDINTENNQISDSNVSETELSDILSPGDLDRLRAKAEKLVIKDARSCKDNFVMADNYSQIGSPEEIVGNDVVFCYCVTMDNSNQTETTTSEDDLYYGFRHGESPLPDDEDFTDTNFDYYTYVKFINVHVKNGKVVYDSVEMPKMQTLGNGHRVPGFETDDDVWQAAGVY